jgi:putative MATE family efflux protein
MSMIQDLLLRMIRNPRPQIPARDLSSGSIHRAIWFLAPAMVLETGILNISDLLDAYWVSQLGSAALAAVTLGIAVRWFVNSLAMGLGIGGMAVVARRVGAQDREAADHATGQTILLGLIISVLLAAGGLAVARPLLQLMGADAEVLPLGLTYLRITFLGAFTWVLVYVTNAMIRGASEARLAMRVLLLTTGVIVVAEPILVLGLGPVPMLGVAGSAGAYVLGFGGGLFLQISSLVRGKANIGLKPRHLHPDLHLMGRIIGIALPSTVQMTLRSASNMVLVALVGAFGTFATAGYGLADRFLLIILVPCFGLGNTSGTLVGQNLGAGKPERAERCAWWVSAYAAGYLLTVTTLLFVFAESLVAFFDSTPAVVAAGASCIGIVTFSLVFDGIGFVLGRGLDGAGNTLPAAIINLLTLWGVQLPAAFALSQWFGLGLVGIWLGRAVANTANGLLFMTWFRQGRWKEREV